MGLYIIMLGVQGAGKGVQAQFISEKYNIPHISTGDMFRAMKTRTDELAQKIQQLMAEGLLIDDDTTNAVVADRLAQDDAQNGVILDGYPRNDAQADFLQEYLAEKGEAVSLVLLMELDLYVAFRRAFGRVSDSETGKSYNIYSEKDALDVETHDYPDNEYPPKIVAQKDGKILKRRPDDANAAAIITRIDTYLETTEPLIQYYSAKGLLQRVNADQPIEIVSQIIQEKIAQVNQ